jgi:hypothetical protein
VEKLLEVEGLRTQFETSGGLVKAVDGISYDLHVGETIAIVGESGSGKSVGALSIMRLIPWPPGRIVGGSVRLAGRDLLKLSDQEMRKVRGRDIGMVFQEPMTSLNPVLTIGLQLTETLEHHLALSREDATKRATLIVPAEIAVQINHQVHERARALRALFNNRAGIRIHVKRVRAAVTRGDRNGRISFQRDVGRSFAGTFRVQFREQFIQPQRLRIGRWWRDAAQIPFRPCHDFLFKRQRHPGGGHDENNHARDDPGDEVLPEEYFAKFAVHISAHCRRRL